jgi:hypothetical protein
MSDVRTAARELAKDANELAADVEYFDTPPSRTQFETVQNALERLQRRLNLLQTEADRWAEERENV